LIIPVVLGLDCDLVFGPPLGSAKTARPKDASHLLNVSVLASDAVSVEKVGAGPQHVRLGGLDLGLEAGRLGTAGRALGHGGQRAGAG
jgi:hypothetical protein